MFLKSIFTGTLITAILVSVLAATRLMKTEDDAKDLVLYEIDEVVMAAPPEPPMEEEDPEETEVESLPVAPIPALDLMSDSTLDSTPLPLTTASFNPELSVSEFAIDREPAYLPVVKIVKPKPKPVAKYVPKYVPKRKVTTKPTVVKKKYVVPVKPKVYTKPKPPAPKREVIKSSYSPNKLDSMPRELRKGSFSWPRSAKGSSGTVKLQIELSTSGKVRVIKVISSTDPKLISAAKRVATGSRFTAPKYRGKVVKTEFIMPYILNKPRR